jgi:hypothetical protein
MQAAKKSLQVQELKAENAALHARIAELETVVERLVDAIESGERIGCFLRLRRRRFWNGMRKWMLL